MRIKESRRGYFLGTHKGAEIEISSEDFEPTHWMPRPASPAPHQEGRADV